MFLLQPYDSFEGFFPFYLSEHSDFTNRRLHVVGTSIIIVIMLCNPILAAGLIGGGAIGYILCNILAGLSHGFVEFATMLVYFLAFAHFNEQFSLGLVRRQINAYLAQTCIYDEYRAFPCLS